MAIKASPKSSPQSGDNELSVQVLLRRVSSEEFEVLGIFADRNKVSEHLGFVPPDFDDNDNDEYSLFESSIDVNLWPQGFVTEGD